MGALACGGLDTYAEDVARIGATIPGLAAEIASFTGVGQVIDWFSSRGHGQPPVDLVGMDEFEYDFLVQLGSEGSWLAFGVT
jgi:hypothetical protein